MLALVDCNSFYASCEQVFRPDLRGKPIVVLSNNDGCIVARNREVKVLGIPGLEPYFKLEPLLKKHNVHVFSSNYELYADLSSRVMDVASSFSPDVEIYSIDELFLSLDGMKCDLNQYAKKIRKTISKSNNFYTNSDLNLLINKTKCHPWHIIKKDIDSIKNNEKN